MATYPQLCTHYRADLARAHLDRPQSASESIPNDAQERGKPSQSAAMSSSAEKMGAAKDLRPFGSEREGRGAHDIQSNRLEDRAEGHGREPSNSQLFDSSLRLETRDRVFNPHTKAIRILKLGGLLLRPSAGQAQLLLIIVDFISALADTRRATQKQGIVHAGRAIKRRPVVPAFEIDQKLLDRGRKQTNPSQMTHVRDDLRRVQPSIPLP